MTFLKKIFSIIKTAFTIAFVTLSAVMNETLNTLAIFSETLDVRDWLNDIFRSQKPSPLTHGKEELQNDNCTRPDDKSTLEKCFEEDIAKATVSDQGRDLTNEQNQENKCDMSQERLVETVENKIDQLTLFENEMTLCNDSSDKSDKILNHSKDIISSKEKNDNISEKLVSQNIKDSIGNIASDNFHDRTAQKTIDTIENTDVRDCENIDSEQIDRGKKSLFNLTENSEILSLEITSEASANSEESNDKLKTENSTKNETLNEEPMRQKKISSLSWDVRTITECLYSMEEHCSPKDYVENEEIVDGYVTLVSYGSYSGESRKVFVCIKDRSIFVWEKNDMENLIMNLSLKYAEVEEDENYIIIDNRVGKRIKLFINSTEDVKCWKEAFTFQNRPLQNEIVPQLVQFPVISDKKIVVIDLGSCSTRAGILTDQPSLPTLFFPTICATNRNNVSKIFGIEALTSEIRKESILSYPVRPSHFVKLTIDIHSVKSLIKVIFDKLSINAKDYMLLLCAPRYFHIETQAALVEFALKDLGLKAIGLARQAIMPLYANNTGTGIVVDIGERLEIIPVVDGYILESAVSRFPIGGETMIHHLKYVLEQQHVCLPSEVENLLAQYFLQKLCYFSTTYQEEFDQAYDSVESVKKTVSLHKIFNLPKDSVQDISIDTARFSIPEGLFQPEMWGIDCPGVHKLIKNAIISSGLDMRRIMAEHIYLSGGVTLIPGFKERLKKEVDALIKPTMTSEVYASTYRHHMAYLGACRLALSNSFSQVCVNLEEWNKHGSKCLKKWVL